MEADMLGMAIKAATIMADPERIGFLALGVLIGLVLGVIPGLGGLVGLSPAAAVHLRHGPLYRARLPDGPAGGGGDLGHHTGGAVRGAGDGGARRRRSSTATRWARKGEAGRAFGAAFSASVLGGLYGRLPAGHQRADPAPGDARDRFARAPVVLRVRPFPGRGAERRHAAEGAGGGLYRADGGDRGRRSADRDAPAGPSIPYICGTGCRWCRWRSACSRFRRSPTWRSPGRGSPAGGQVKVGR